MIDEIAQVKRTGIDPFSGDTTKAERLLERPRSIKDIVFGCLPIGRYVTTEGHEYYVNHNDAILFAGDPSSGTFLPTTRYMMVPDMDTSKTEHFHNPEIDLTVSYEDEFRAGVDKLTEIYFEHYNKFMPEPITIAGSNTTMSSALDFESANRLLNHYAPVFTWSTPDGNIYFENNDGLVLLGWNPKERVLVPTTPDMHVQGSRVEHIEPSGSILLMDKVLREVVLKM